MLERHVRCLVDLFCEVGIVQRSYSHRVNIAHRFDIVYTSYWLHINIVLTSSTLHQHGSYIVNIVSTSCQNRIRCSNIVHTSLSHHTDIDSTSYLSFRHRIFIEILSDTQHACIITMSPVIFGGDFSTMTLNINTLRRAQTSPRHRPCVNVALYRLSTNHIA